jgi:hypothetical protein
MPIVLAGPRLSARAFSLGVAVLCTLPTAAIAADIVKGPDSFKSQGVTRDNYKRPVTSVKILNQSVNESISRSVSSDGKRAFSVFMSAAFYELTPSKGESNHKLPIRKDRW